MAWNPYKPYTYWTTLSDNELTVDNVTRTLGLVPDDLWAAAAVADRVVDHVEVQKNLLELGIGRTDAALERSRKATSPLLAVQALTAENGPVKISGDVTEGSSISDTLHTYFEAAPDDAQLCNLRATLLHRLDRLNTFVEISKGAPTTNSQDYLEHEVEEWEDDPWVDETTNASMDIKAKSSEQFPIPLSTFLVEDLYHISCQLASWQWFEAVQTLQVRHRLILWPFRLAILDNVPEHVHPTNFRELLPTFDVSSNFELELAGKPWRVQGDWSELDWVQTALKGRLSIAPTESSESALSHCLPRSLLAPDEISKWYKSRVDKIIKATGLIDIALATIQHGASQGIPDLDKIGEELSLLSRLVYDAPQGPDVEDDWTLHRWSSMGPSAVVKAYLANSTPESIFKDIPRLVLPYLFVLESRAEREGNPDPELPNRLLYEYILSAPLEITAGIFEASKPTLPPSQRLIKDDQDIVRLALACLYGSDSLNEWSTMSRIFECLPAWDIPRDEDNDEDVTDTTISSLGAFVAPSTDHSRCTASDLLVFFKPLSIASLSRALDILDVHLESGEILSRWSVPAPLRWFLQSNGDIKEQRAWANRMARRAGGSDDQLDSKEDWEWLLEDMLKLTGKGDTGLPGAFGLLTRDDIMQLFMSGLLSTGRFDIAKDILRSSSHKLLIDVLKIEDICLECSREFYDNAQSGNYKFGDLKLAYDCLDVPQLSDRIVREKEFIEATSRISSFNVFSRPGTLISPIEIRLTSDRLSLISRVLSSNNDAYKHSEVILDLAHKLGYRDDVVAEVKTLAMLADTALQAEDFSRAFELSERMVERVSNLRDTSLPDDIRVTEVSEVCWVACFQLGRQPEFEDVGKKLSLLGQALQLCPPEKLHDILSSWSRLAEKDIDFRRERLSSTNEKGIAASTSRERTFVSGNVASSLRARLQEFHMPSPPLLSTPDAAALASRTFRSVTANFPFSVGRGSQASDREDGSRASSLFKGDGEDVSSQATRVFNKGIGWLIGADDE
ncbi:Neuroblastoma-amplified sequence [Termitomyces sp. J132]|nr:Neuroblastoma-amplified sequence [Termitomyces sp. J132]